MVIADKSRSEQAVQTVGNRNGWNIQINAVTEKKEICSTDCTKEWG